MACRWAMGGFFNKIRSPFLVIVDGQIGLQDQSRELDRKFVYIFQEAFLKSVYAQPLDTKTLRSLILGFSGRRLGVVTYLVIQDRCDIDT